MEQIVKTLVLLSHDPPILVLVSGSNRVDFKKLEGLTGYKIKKADANKVKDVTGFAIGGVPPIGHRVSFPVYVDRDLLSHDVVWAAAGTPHAVFSVAPAKLVQATSGIVAELKEG